MIWDFSPLIPGVLSGVSGVFSTGATWSIVPAILRKRLIAPAILDLPFQYSLFTVCTRKTTLQFSDLIRHFNYFFEYRRFIFTYLKNVQFRKCTWRQTTYAKCIDKQCVSFCCAFLRPYLVIFSLFLYVHIWQYYSFTYIFEL